MTKKTKVAYAEAPSYPTEAIIVGLKPGTTYQFHVACISSEKMLVPGSSVVSEPVKLLKAEYAMAWFFEGGEDDVNWAAFEGLRADCTGPTSGGGLSSTALDNIRFDIFFLNEIMFEVGDRPLRCLRPLGIPAHAVIHRTF